MKYIYFFLALLVLLISCTNITRADSNNDSYISERQAKEIVSKAISESDYYQQFYILDSEHFDERVYDISWGETVLVSIIPDGRFFKEYGKYYLFTGVLSNGRVLIAQTVNAKTGELMDGVLLNDENSDVLTLASKNQTSAYAARMGYSQENIEAIYYFDGTPYTIDPIFCWKYCINPKSNRSVCDNMPKINDYIFIDPWIQQTDAKNDQTMTSSNAFFSKFKINHRAYQIDNSSGEDAARSVSKRNMNTMKFKPID